MNGMNKAVVSIVYGIALLFTGACLALSVLEFQETGVPRLEVFSPLFDASGITGPFSQAYADVMELLFGWAGVEAMYAVMVAGFVLAVAGMFTGYPLDVKGVGNRAEVIWTERPNAAVRCLSGPWGLITAAYGRNRYLVILPIALLPLYGWWSLILTISMVPVFVVVKLAIGVMVDRARRRDRGAYERDTQYAVCPVCKRNFDYPQVRCGCGIVLDYPVPGIHGIGRITCNNGHSMDCRAGLRDSLKTVCPHCGESIETRESKPICISLVGSVGSGKTTLMLSAVDSIQKSAVRHGVNTDAVTPGIGASAIAGRMDVPATPEGELDSECLFIRSPYLHGRELVFNDISGREFEPRKDRFIFQEYYSYTDGIVFCVDPLNLDSRTSKTRPMDVFESFHFIFTRVKGFGPETVSNVPLALVLTKRDVTGVDDDGVEGYLRDNGQGEFVRILKSLFSDVRMFSVCCFEDSSRPVWWIMESSDPELVEHVPLE